MKPDAELPEAAALRRRIRALLIFFIVALVLSGLTAFPLLWETGILDRWANGAGSSIHHRWPALAGWLHYVHFGLDETYTDYPFVAYGTDWLAFAHLVIAVAFIGPLRDPIRNLWVVEWGMIACAGILPLALIWGPLREIPLYWRLGDCSFGVLGIIPLWLTRRAILRLAKVKREA